MEGIEGIDAMTKELEKLQDRQDQVMRLSSRTVRLAGMMITAIHSHRVGDERKLNKELAESIEDLEKMEKGFEYYTQQAHQEYVEAMIFCSIVRDMSIPTRAALMEKTVPYILGIMDVVGELKREAFDELMAKNRKKAMEYYSLMKAIYDSTLHMRFANSIMPGFRRKQDTARIQLESVAAELL